MHEERILGNTMGEIVMDSSISPCYGNLYTFLFESGISFI
jgi:hypothetical protein